MFETVAGALITGVLTLVGVLISNGRAQAVTETKLSVSSIDCIMDLYNDQG